MLYIRPKGWLMVSVAAVMISACGGSGGGSEGNSQQPYLEKIAEYADSNGVSTAPTAEDYADAGVDLQDKSVTDINAYIAQLKKEDADEEAEIQKIADDLGILIKDTDGDGTPDGIDADDDNDGIKDTDEKANGTDPLKADSDGDGVNDKEDKFPKDETESADADGDGEGDNEDLDDDNDDVPDTDDAFPHDKDESVDTDGDGKGNNADTDDDGDGFSDKDEIKAGSDPLDKNSIPTQTPPPTDTDGDGIPDNTDADDDNDGVPDADDAFPLDKNESVDTDGDGIGNNADTDDDGDGYSDAAEIAAGSDPLDKNSVPTPVNTANFTIDAIGNTNQTENSAYTSATPNLSGDTPIGAVIYKLGGADASLFKVNTSTGVVTMIARDYEAPQDTNTDNTYEVSITATDSDGNTDSEAWNVTVTDVADIKPALSSFSGNIEENAVAGDPVGDINITKTGDSNITAITLSGAGSGNFEVSTSGVITIATGATLDYETTTAYSLAAIATNTAGDSASVNVNIAIDNIAESVPVLATTSDEKISELLFPAGLTIATIVLDGSNIDENISTGFSIVSGNTGGDFAINSNGDITKVNALDYTRTSSYTLGIVASNAAGASNPVTQVININSVPTASDFKLILDVDKSVVTANWNTKSLATDEDGDTLMASVTTGGSYGSSAISSNTLSYQKITETNNTDTVVLEITDGTHDVVIAVNIESLYWEQVTGGQRNHTAAIKSDGTMWGWGNGNSTPVQESSNSTDWVGVSGGYYHTVAIKNNGEIWSWGSNSHGQLGNNSTTASNDPVQESTNATDWSTVDAGGFHTAALKSNGTLWSWGNNEEGEMGDGTHLNNRHVPTQEHSYSTWSSLSVGGAHTTAIKPNGTLWSWGYTGDGQVGNNSISPNHVLLPQQEHSKSSNWSALSAGGRHTIAMKSNNEVWAWGNNEYGELGDGANTDRRVPVMIDNGSTGWSAFSAALFHTIAVKPDSTLWSWGKNTHGALGNNSLTNSNTPVQEASQSNDWSTYISGGGDHTAAIKTNGRLWTWGRNAEGQLGNDTTTDSPIPIEVQPRQ